MAYVSDSQLFPVRREPRSIWERTGLTPTQERRLNTALIALLVVFIGGWIYSVALAIERGDPPQVARRLGAASFSPAANPDVSFLVDAALREFIDWEEVLGESGELRVVLQEPGETAVPLPDSLPAEVGVVYRAVGDTTAVTPPGEAPPRPGIWSVLLQARDLVREVPNLSVISQVPAAVKQGGRIDDYRIGDWPNKEGIYAPPKGFVQVTRENQDTWVSTHFQLKDFVTKGQENVWPKYVVISPRLLDKMELTIQQLEAEGHPVENVFVVSGFRTPWYNARGGNTSGRGALSRHMYGDASDIAIDNDYDGRMDDLNGDGKVNVRDARIIAEAAERVETKYPHLVGGIGIYAPTGAHSGMVHIDARGNRARWGAW